MSFRPDGAPDADLPRPLPDGEVEIARTKPATMSEMIPTIPTKTTSDPVRATRNLMSFEEKI
jgi:hypothetical protein